MALLAFRDLVLLKLHLEETLGAAASVPPAVTQMLLVLQGIHESGAPTLEYYQLERLVEDRRVSVSQQRPAQQKPAAVRSVLHVRGGGVFVQDLFGIFGNFNPVSVSVPSPHPESRHLRPSGSLLGDQSQPEITITQHHTSSDSSSLAPLVEQEGEAYLEKSGGVRRHTVANAHSDVRLLSASGRMHAGTEKDSGMGEDEGGVEFLVGGGARSPRPFSSQPDMVESPRGGVIC
ncbi:hypothetical protein L3Q82_007087 [Scortum barcoo]|uniref:Uncharacterized protein n=1 Tax=Scortum barcoo TaxID=214431 RepID=A0ACB8WT91_9TELE|nr:hypothetical protein L3Q82_007087 [Scortum barcoo]